ncbi:MAG: Amino acid permease family protein [uncultured bacterium]|nr:MAG: Amino acid permease family protein [uncultured bacterium]
MTKPGKLGLLSLTSLVTGNMIGSGVFLLPSQLARVGGISLLSWLFTATGAFLLALVFSRMSNAIPKTGGPYVYVEHGMGRFMGFQTAYLYWIYTGVGNIAITVALIGYLRVFFPQLANPVWGMTVATALLGFLVMVNASGISKAGLLQLLTTIFKILPLIAIAIFGWNYFHLEYITDNFNVTSSSNFSAFSHAATLTLWAFVGVESAAVPAESVDNPRRNIPLATLFGTAIATVLYIACSTVVMGMIPTAELAASTSPFAAAAKMIFGRWGELIIAGGAVISCFGCLNGWILIQSQISMAIADDGLFPKIFAKRNKFNVPGWGLVVNFVLLCSMLWLTLDADLVNQFNLAILVATTACLFVYFSVGMSELIWLINDDKLKSGGNKIHAAIALLASAYSIWAFVSSGQTIVYGVMLLFMAGIALYTFSMLRGKAMNILEK